MKKTDLGPCIDMDSGKKLYFLHPHPDQIDIHDIALGLSGMGRFYNQLHKWYSVAEHSVRVSWILPEDDPMLQFMGLMHDGAEAYVGDVHSFLKRLIPQYQEIEYGVERVIALKYGMKFPYPAAVKMADLTLLATEKRDLKHYSDWKSSPYPPLKNKIVPWGREGARKEFLKRFNELQKKLK